MARATVQKPVKTAAKASESRALVNWDTELAKEAEAAASREASTGGGGNFFSFRGATLSYQDSPVPNNEMAVVIVDSIFENVYYEGRYDPENPAPPTCFAFAREESELQPHKVVVAADQAVNSECESCPMNEWASADTGRGKACRNTRRLAVINAGSLGDRGRFEPADMDHLASTEIAYMRLPVTSVKGYATFVKQVAGTLRRPPYGIFAKIRVVPDAKSQFKVVFEAIDQVPNDLMDVVVRRRKEAQISIEQPYSLEVSEPEPKRPAARGGAKAQAKLPPKKPGPRKY